MASIDEVASSEAQLSAEQRALEDLHKRVVVLEKAVAKAVKGPRKQVDQVKIYLGGDETCFPTPDSSHGFDLKFSSDSTSPPIPPRMAFDLDCGFAVEMPKGMRMAVQVTKEWAMKGLILTTDVYDEDVGRRRATVMAYNVGKQILAFQHGEVLGKVWFVKADQVALVSCK